jgi:hypothetical protein
MDESYIVISRWEDEPCVGILTKNELQERMDELEEEGFEVHYLDSIPDPDLMYFPCNSFLIIKGKIVVPKPVEKIKRMEIE